MDKLSKLIARYEKADNERSNWVSLWEECYNFAFPKRTGFYSTVSGAQRTDEIFDSSVVHAVGEFASRMQAGLTPNFAKWYEFEAGSEVPKDQRPKVSKALEQISDYVWEVLQTSNLNQELHEGYLDLAVGTGTLLVEEGDFDRPVRFTMMPQTQVTLERGPFGDIQGVYRTRMLKLRDIKTIWPKATIPEDVKAHGDRDPEHEFVIIESCLRNWEKRDTETHDFTIFIKEPQHIILEGEFKGDGSNPWISFRWSKTAGETYGRGPLLNALADVKTLNEIVMLGMKNASLSITGMWQADDDGLINPDTIELIPGTIIPRAMGSRGLEPLTPPGRFEMGQFLLEEMRHNIRKALYNETLGKPEGTPMSATEVHERMADLSRTIGSAYGRLHTELVTPLLRRVVHILRKQGRIEVPKINGREVRIRNVSPLAQAQNNENVARVARWLELMNGGFGPQMTNLVVKAEEAAVYTGQQIGVPESLIRDQQEREAIAQAIAQTQEALPGQTPQGPPQQGGV
jgi:hypothetical protein